MRGDRRQGQSLPEPPDRGRLALSVDRRDLREGAPERAHRISCGDHCGRRQQRRPARSARHGYWAFGGGDLLD